MSKGIPGREAVRMMLNALHNAANVIAVTTAVECGTSSSAALATTAVAELLGELGGNESVNGGTAHAYIDQFLKHVGGADGPSQSGSRTKVERRPSEERSKTKKGAIFAVKAALSLYDSGNWNADETFFAMAQELADHGYEVVRLDKSKKEKK